MAVPPGITYLFGVVPHFALPSIATYLAFNFIQARKILPFQVPHLVVGAVALLARPAIFYVSQVYSRWANKNAAKARGAIIAPYVQQSGLSIIQDIMESDDIGYPGDVFLKWNQDYGNVANLDIGTSTLLLTNEPEHVKAILATQFDSFEKGELFHAQMDSLLGDGVFNTDGELWKFHRAMTRPFFTRERISDFEIYDRNWETSLKLARERLAKGCSIDVQDFIGRFTLDSATEFLFGSNVGSLKAGIPYHPSSVHSNGTTFSTHPSTAFLAAFTGGLIYCSKRIGAGYEWPLWEFMKDKALPMRRIIDGFTEPLLKDALEKRGMNKEQGNDMGEKEELTLLSHLVNHTQDTKILKDELINLLVAGRDTTMCLLAFSVYMLAEHPDIEKRLRQEIYEKVGRTAGPRHEHMRELKYMRAFLNEVLRLYPPVPINARITTQPVVLPAGGPGLNPIYVPKDVNCLYTVINMHRRTDLWGPDALTFDPDRFLDTRVQKYLVPNPYIFCPFNAGPRICLGQQFAYHEATYYLVRLLQNFTEFKLDSSANMQPPADWATAEGSGLKQTEKIVPSLHLTMFIKGGLWVYMKELQKEGS